MNLLAALGVLLVQRPAKLPAKLDGRFGIRKGYIHRKSFEKKSGESMRAKRPSAEKIRMGSALPPRPCGNVRRGHPIEPSISS